MLLNEFLKEHRKVEEKAQINQRQAQVNQQQEAIISNQQREIDKLSSALEEEAGQIQR